MRKVYIPFFLKFVFVLIVVSTLPLILINIQTSRINRTALQTVYLELHSKTVSNIATKIQNHFNSLSQTLPFIEDTILRTDISWENKQHILESLLNINTNIASISIVDLSGKEKTKIYNPDLINNPKLRDFAQMLEFKKFVSSNQKNFLSQIYSLDGNSYIDGFYKEKNFFICITLTLEPLFKQLVSERVGKTGFISIVDPNNKKLVYTNSSPNYDNSFILENSSLLNLASKSLSVGSQEFEQNKIKYLAAYITVPIVNWIVILQQNKDDAFHSSLLLTRKVKQLIFLAVILSIIISFFIAKGVTQPILKIIDAAKTVSLGNFNIQLNIKTRDELEILGETFTNMAKKLNEYAEIQLDKIIAEKTKTEAIIFSIQDGIILTDYNGNILLINNKAKNILNLPPNQSFENKNILEILPQEIKVVIENSIKEPNKIFELDLSKPNFTSIYQTSTTPVTTLKGEKIGIVSVLHDITLEKELEKIKEDFLHSITHDLRNPMTSIRGFIKFLLDGTVGELNAQQKKMLETMDRASFRLLGMINDILDIAKLEAGKMELDLKTNDIVKIVKSVSEVMQPQYERKKISLEIIPTKPEIVAKIDSNFIERVFINLIGNAIKFTPENGKITVGLEEQEDKIVCFVQDTGEGIPQEHLTTVFEKFGQVKNKSKGGTGLGLTICKHVVEAHGGKIWVESVYGHGAKFIFYIPKNLNN
jgi:PAS domain S-box-containing protein